MNLCGVHIGGRHVFHLRQAFHAKEEGHPLNGLGGIPESVNLPLPTWVSCLVLFVITTKFMFRKRLLDAPHRGFASSLWGNHCIIVGYVLVW